MKSENISIYFKYILIKKYFWHVFNHVSIYIFQIFRFYDSNPNIFNVAVYKGVFISGWRYLTYILYTYYDFMIENHDHYDFMIENTDR